MSWKLDSDRPIHSQLLEIVQTNIVSGLYPLGEKLPSVRDLAAEAGVNPNTMQRAFSELERRNLIRTERTMGRFVTEDKEMIQKARGEMAREQLKLFFEKMEQLGYTKDEILSYVEESVKEVHNG